MAEPWFFEVLADHPLPFPNECLSGYLLRLAQVNGFTIFWDLIADLFPSWKKPQQIRLLRWEFPLEDWGRIPLRTQLPVESLNCLTVAPWIEKFRSSPDPNRSIYWTPGHFLQGIVNPDLRVCPLCLQEQPYIRLIWRLALVSACVEHGCLLQDRCCSCGAGLTAAEQGSQHMRCPTCGTDLRALPVISATNEILEAQRQLLPSLHFLLDPAITLTQGVVDPSQTGNYTPAQAVGLKVHFLRSLRGLSIQTLSRQLGVANGAISALELGKQAPFRLYLTYLEALSQSWPALAALQIPTEFVLQLQIPRHLPLRLCPNPPCPSHRPPASTHVVLMADMPERQAARFRCTDCGRRFTRSYDGKLLTKPRRPLIHPGDPPVVPKIADEIVLLKKLGLQGENNRQIARRLGWGEKTVRTYWIALDIEEQVHQAQSQRREKKKQEHRTDIRSHLEQILQPLLNRDEEISLRQIGRAMGYNSDFLHTCPDLTARVQSLIQPHNAQIRQRQRESTTACILQALDEMKNSDRIVKVEEIAQKAGMNYSKLREVYPELLPILHKTLVEHSSQLQAIRLKAQVDRIDEAASRLISRGVRLTYKVILLEAGLSKYSSKSPAIREALIRWMGNFAPRD